MNDESKKDKKVSFKKAVKALDDLVKELDQLPAATDARRKDHRTIDGLRKQIEGMSLMLRGSCGKGQDDFSFPG